MSSTIPPYTQLDGDSLNDRLRTDQSLVVIDVREAYEYERRRIPGSVLVPLSSIHQGSLDGVSPDKEMVVVCEHGIRSEHAAHFFCQLGFSNVFNLVGGLAGYDGPTVSGEEVQNR